MRIAIVGSGVSGLSALWILKQHSDHEVNIYEKASYAGGHVHSIEARRNGKDPLVVDTAFTTFNKTASPNVGRFFELLGVSVVEAPSTISVSRDGILRWASGEGLKGANILSLFKPQTWRAALDVVRFRYYATDLLEQNNNEGLTIRAYLEQEDYSREFFGDYLLPLITTLWLTPDAKVALDMPAAVVIESLRDHGLMGRASCPQWLAVKGGAKTYIDKITDIVPPENLHLNTEIVGITSHDYGVTLEEASGVRHVYDHVILATPANVTLNMLKRGGYASDTEQLVLSANSWLKVDAALHWDDESIIHLDGTTQHVDPRAKTAIRYNGYTTPPEYDDAASKSGEHASVTFDLNDMEGIPHTGDRVLLTINPAVPAETIPQQIGHRTYSLPYPMTTTVDALRRLGEIQNQRRISYVGAWTGNGLHEAGFNSALDLVTAEPFCASSPFTKTSDPDTEGDNTALRVTTPHAPASPAAKSAVAALERIRRWVISPYWAYIAWPVVVSLIVASQLCRSLRISRLVPAVAQLKASWQA